ncbi:hypothetical protein Tco_1449993 [Tanacetum coccineum]
MAFRLRNVGATYQALVDKEFRCRIGVNVVVYVDEMVIKSNTVEASIQDIPEMFQNLRMPTDQYPSLNYRRNSIKTVTNVLSRPTSDGFPRDSAVVGNLLREGKNKEPSSSSGKDFTSTPDAKGLLPWIFGNYSSHDSQSCRKIMFSKIVVASWTLLTEVNAGKSCSFFLGQYLANLISSCSGCEASAFLWCLMQQALRSIEQNLNLDKLYVLGANCVDNGT